MREANGSPPFYQQPNSATVSAMRLEIGTPNGQFGSHGTQPMQPPAVAGSTA